MYNKLTIIGYLGRDPEMKYTPEGNAVTSFSVAVSDGYGDKKATMWVRVVVWGKQAEACNRYLRKGSVVAVEGALLFDKATGGPKVWSGKDGGLRASFEMRADRVVFMPKSKDSGFDEYNQDAGDSEF
jgi:single-strand DNA-binding protein